MDLETSKSARTKIPSKLSGVLRNAVKVWKSASSGGMLYGNTGDFRIDEAGKGDGNHNGKIHPKSYNGMLAANRVDFDSMIISNLLDAISSLKLAYIQYQKAHIPYDSGRIRSADELVELHLESISDMERYFIENRRIVPKPGPFFTGEISLQEKRLESLLLQLQAKNSEVLRLGWEVEELVQRNIELEEEIRRTFSPEEEILSSYRDPDMGLLKMVFEVAYKSIHEFSKPLIGLMKASCLDLDRAADSIVAPVPYAERSHKKYAFEAYISRRIFTLKGKAKDLVSEEGDVGSIMKFKDPFDALINDPDSNFAQFCSLKFLSIVHPDMELLFFGHLDQRNLIMDSKHPRTPFYRAFVKMARWVWVLLVMAAILSPQAKMFYAENGSKYEEMHMESIVNVDGSWKSTIGFTVMPGFWIGTDDVLPCRVYLI